jgi:hypothetical protein
MNTSLTFSESGNSPPVSPNMVTPHDPAPTPRPRYFTNDIRIFALLHEIAEVAAAAVARCYSVNV